VSLPFLFFLATNLLPVPRVQHNIDILVSPERTKNSLLTLASSDRPDKVRVPISLGKSIFTFQTTFNSDKRQRKLLQDPHIFQQFSKAMSENQVISNDEISQDLRTMLSQFITASNLACEADRIQHQQDISELRSSIKDILEGWST
jgi:hypothetical protein